MQSGTWLRRLNTVSCFQNRIGNDREVQSKLVATYRGFSLFDGNGLLDGALYDVIFVG